MVIIYMLAEGGCKSLALKEVLSAALAVNLSVAQEVLSISLP